MAAIITYKFRIHNASKFKDSFSNDKVYLFIGRPTPWFEVVLTLEDYDGSTNFERGETVTQTSPNNATGTVQDWDVTDPDNPKLYLTNVSNTFDASSGADPVVGGTSTASYAVETVDDGHSESSPPTPEESVDLDNNRWHDMIAAKKITSGNVSHAIPRKDWASGTVYDTYSDTLNMFDDGTGSVRDFYVLTDENKVYKCLFNNDGGQSTTKPTSTSTNAFTTADGYIWQFMYEIDEVDNDKFLTDSWMPVKYLSSDDGSDQWDVQDGAVDGSIDVIEVVDGGSGYGSAPTVTIEGDGSGATATATLNGGQVDKITIDNAGSGYTTATVSLSGGTPSTAAVAKAVVSPPGGHGSNPVHELGGKYVIARAQLKYSDSNLPDTNDYRKVGLVVNPEEFGGGTTANADSYDQRTNLTFTNNTGNGSDFQEDEWVYQGTSVDDYTALARVVAFDDDPTEAVLYVTDVRGEFADNTATTGETSGAEFTTKASSSVTNPGLERGTGEIIFIENRQAVTRTSQQTEDFKPLIEF